MQTPDIPGEISLTNTLILCIITSTLTLAIGGGLIHQNQQTQITEAQDRIPNTTSLGKASYTAFNNSQHYIENSNWEEARKHIDAGNSLLSAMQQTMGEEPRAEQWGRLWLGNELYCLERENNQQCKTSVNATVTAFNQSEAGYTSTP